MVAAQCVTAGITLLDRKGPDDWRLLVNFDALDMSSMDMCVLGQVFDSYHEALIELGLHGVGTDIECGFDSQEMYSHRLLTEVWKELALA